VHPDPLSGPSMARIENWIETCKSKHSACNILDTTLPTRVLDLARYPTIFLCEVTKENGPYIALSHCWGLAKTFTTTQSTIDVLKNGFNADELPATFKDAIAVTRALGVQYLWIDSLCIIQGDAEDWKREAGKMASVYANSYLTISASNASGDDEGFLKKRKVFHHPLKIITSTGKSAQYYLRKQELEPTIFSVSPAAVYTEPLDTRAWTLQEALLPKRVLRFNTDESGWECTRAGLRERWPDVNNGGRTYKLEDLWPKPTAFEANWPFGGWYELIGSFVKRNLTYDTDKLPSIAGIVSKLSDMVPSASKSPSGYKYCAGIWWQDLPSGLLWAAEGTDEGETSKLKKPSRYLAPTWSWASLNGPTYYTLAVIENTKGHGPLTSVLYNDVHLEGATDGGYMGCQPGSYLSLSAPLLKIKSGTNKKNYFGTTDEMIFPFPELPDENLLGTALLDLPGKLDDEIIAIPLMLSAAKQFYAGWHDHETAVPNKRIYFTGIMIRRARDGRDGYERVGMFKTGASTDRDARMVCDWPVQDIKLY
jgi:hypothetical protein